MSNLTFTSECIPSNKILSYTGSMNTSISIGAKNPYLPNALKKRLKYSIFALIFLFALPFLIQSSLLNAQEKQVEKLNRGLVAVRDGDGYYLKWRLLGNEPYNTGFNVYRDEEILNDEPLTGPTGFTDSIAPENSIYTVAAVIEDVEQPKSKPARIINLLQGSNSGYFDIPLNRPPTGPHGGTYSPNDASVGDVTGNGEYEIILKWDPSNAKDNSQSGITDNVFIDAYTLDGVMLWRIDLGPNIRAGAHYTQFMVYDFDGNGRAEIMMKTAPGTIDGNGNFISKGPAAEADHGAIYRNSGGYVLRGPEYLTVFSGETGEELATVEYIPVRGSVSAWGDNYGNRVDRFLAGVAYVDGERPSAIFARGYYTRMVVVAWDWRDGELTHRWSFDTNDPEYNNSWTGQGNHQLSVVDANNDGKHDIVYGSVVIGSDGVGMHTTGLGHGDALHATHMIKGDTIPKIFMPHEWDIYGVSLRNADDGTMVFTNHTQTDLGRGVAADLDPEVPGFKFWASKGMGLFDINGDVVGSVPISTNHVIWWDGELSRELLDQNQIRKWSVANNTNSILLGASGASSINGTKANPNLQVDLFGDWREEVIFRTNDNTRLRVFTTTIPTEHRLYTFMHDPVYRVAIAWQNTAYNQPPHPGFYVASDMDFPPPDPSVSEIEMEFIEYSPVSISPNMQVNDGDTLQISRASVEIGSSVRLMPEVDDEGGTWSWNGPDGFESDSSEIELTNLTRKISGTYAVTYTTEDNSKSKYYFTIDFVACRATFRVIMPKSGVEFPDGAFITGNFTDNEIYPMEHEGDSVYSIAIDLKIGDPYAYYFLVTDNLEEAEDLREIVPEECALSDEIMGDPEWIGDRAFVAPANDITITYVWSSCANAISTTGISRDKIEELLIYPNPTNGIVNIAFDSPKENVTIEILNFSGKILKNLQYRLIHKEVTTDISGLTKGVYFMRVVEGENSYVNKVILN